MDFPSGIPDNADMTRANSGILIAIEGIDGAGKTTQVNAMTEFFLAAGEPVIQSKEPTDGVWGQKIRKSASNGRMTLQDELAAFVEDRKEHLRDKIMPALSNGMTVILDRYFYSTIAYQGSRGGEVSKIESLMLESAPTPDLVILLDVPSEIGLARISNGRGETPNAFETNANLKAVRGVFLDLAKNHPNFIVIDGTPSASIVEREILDAMLEGILYKRHCEKHWGCDDPFNCTYRITGTCQWAKMKKIAASTVSRRPT